MYFEDFFEGYTFKTGSRKLLKEDIISFATEWGNQVFHLNEDLASQSKFKGLIASG
jgi:acyl dehydratase